MVSETCCGDGAAVKSPQASLLLVSGFAAAAGASENAVHSVLAAVIAAGAGEEGCGDAIDTLAVGAEAKAPQMSPLEAAAVVAATAGVGGNEANEGGTCCGCGDGFCCCGCAGDGALVSQLC